MIRRPSFPRLPTVNGQCRHRSNSRATFTITRHKGREVCAKDMTPIMSRICKHPSATWKRRDTMGIRGRSHPGSPCYRHGASVAPSHLAINPNTSRGANWDYLPLPRTFPRSDRQREWGRAGHQWMRAGTKGVLHPSSQSWEYRSSASL